MNGRAGESAVIAAGLAYLLVLGWAVGNVSYDVWGALVVVPIYGLIGVAIVRRTFRGTQQPLAVAMSWGLLIKLGGTLARYWVGFEAYDGGIDASRYHRFGAEAASKIWSGEASLVTVLPRGRGTEFLEHFTTFVYTLTGTSQLAGFLTFSFLAYIGTVLMVKAAAIAVPGLAAKRYAWMCVVFPSVVYWPASIGKEAAIMLGLGVATFGIASMLANGRWVSSIVLIVAGLGFTSLVRPHVAGIWIAGALPALVVSLVRRPRTTGDAVGTRTVSRVGIVVVLALALLGFSMISSVTVRYLAPDSEEVAATDRLTQIVESTTTRTSEADSSFTPLSVSSPTSWPYASIRTLTRPLPHEARNIAQLISAAEMVALLVIFVLARRRLYNIPRLLISSPYVTFAVTTLFLAGLAYASFANLGVLTRQKSLVFPLMLLLPCLPAHTWRRPTEDRHVPDAPAVRRTPSAHEHAPVRTVSRDIDDLWA